MGPIVAAPKGYLRRTQDDPEGRSSEPPEAVETGHLDDIQMGISKAGVEASIVNARDRRRIQPVDATHTESFLDKRSVADEVPDKNLLPGQPEGIDVGAGKPAGLFIRSLRFLIDRTAPALDAAFWLRRVQSALRKGSARDWR